MIEVSLDEAYRTACQLLGEALVRESLAQRALAAAQSATTAPANTDQ
jgi:hypothetical protein